MALSLRIGLVLGLISGWSPAHADEDPVPLISKARLELSGFLGVHLSSDTSDLGAVDGNRASIANSVAFGPRASYVVLPWLVLESELPIAPASARDSAENVNVFVFEPRLATRFDTVEVRGGLLPFATLGVGLPVAISGNRQIIATDLSVRPYIGGGVMLRRDRDWNLRVDARLFAQPERGDPLVTPELEIGFGLYRSFGYRPQKKTLGEWFDAADKDDDGITDDDDKCPDRAEDRDGYEDFNGCPDIDNDFDLVLDIADKCPGEAESHNGYSDEDGCPDKVPDQVRDIVGVVRGVTFRPRSARLVGKDRRALRRVVRTMKKHKTVRIVVTGHADTRESPKKSDQLALRRARAVRDYLVRRKIRPWRIKIASKGDREPVASNDRRRGQRKNRRIEISLRVYAPRN